MGGLILPATEAVRLLTETNPAVLVLSGAINLEDAEEFRRLSLLLIAEHKEFEIDWSAAEYLSTSAIQILLALFQAVRASGRSVRVVPGDGAFGKYVELAGLAGCFKSVTAPAPVERRRRRKGEKN